jgi:hypothetical protein
MTGFEAVGVFENAFHPPFERSAIRSTILRKLRSGKRKDDVLSELFEC